MNESSSKAARGLEIAVGLLFVASAFLKAVDASEFAVQIAHYGVVRDPALVRAIAYATIAMEAGLGMMLTVGLRAAGWTRLATLAVLAGFSALIVYAWRYQGLSDCGCFGKYIKMTPGQSLAKNGVLLAMLVGAMGFDRRARSKGASAQEAPPPHSSRLAARCVSTLVVVAVIVVTAALVRPPTTTQQPADGKTSPTVSAKDNPFAQFSVPTDNGPLQLGQGDYLVAFLSTTCEHCQAATKETLNDASRMAELPRMVGLMLGDEQSLADFKAETEAAFPLMLVEPLVFFQFIGQAPPRLIHVRDGKQLQFWDEPIPDLAKLVESLTSAATPAPAPR